LKFQPERPSGVNLVTRIERSRVWVGASEFGHSVLVPWTGGVQRWEVARFESLQPAHFEQVLALQPELVIFGSGTRLRFVSPALTRALIELHIGVETMDTGAACRTYNVLAAEGRSVLAALLIEDESVAAA
jgi:uncharacterized protein